MTPDSHQFPCQGHPESLGWVAQLQAWRYSRDREERSGRNRVLERREGGRRTESKVRPRVEAVAVASHRLTTEWQSRETVQIPLLSCSNLGGLKGQSPQWVFSIPNLQALPHRTI